MIKKHKKTSLSFKWIFAIIAAYGILCIVILAERSGIRYTAQHAGSTYIEPSTITLESAPAAAKTTLLLFDSTQVESSNQAAQWEFILASMDVPYRELDVYKEPFPELDKYEKIVFTAPNLSCVQSDLDALTSWVNGGGNALFSATLQVTPAFAALSQKLGIVEYGTNGYNKTAQLVFDDFMVGGNTAVPLSDPFESSLYTRLTDDCIVHITDDSEFPVPLLWERKYGSGRFVVVNLGFNVKATRGIYAAAYSLMGSACVYPVVNSSTFYIDDFPSPVPSGNGEYVKDEFSRDISSFYTNVWWPDMQQLSRKYGIRYTGVIIENYEDDVAAPFERNSDTSRFSFFGKSLLQLGGELGYHGYNHQPLVLESFDYHGEEDYEKWPTIEDMTQAVSELSDFAQSIFDGAKLAVYVPPSNILSAEGRKVLADTLPDLQGIASIYYGTGVGYGQELSVADDGIVEMPRIVSGAELTDYMQLALISELNFHFYNSHFIHPDDLLDVDRGAAKGWGYLRGTLEAYVSKLAKDAPLLRDQVASEEVGAIQRYCYAEVASDVSNSKITVDITNFFDEAYCFVRINEGTPAEVTGGTLQNLTSNLYLLTADESHVEIELEGAA